MHCGGVNIPLYAGYPTGFREIAGVLIKGAVIQAPPLVAFGACAGTAGAYFIDGTGHLSMGAIIGVKAAGVILAARCIQLVLTFSSGTNDTSRFRLRSIALVGAVGLMALGFLGLAGASFLVPHPAAAWGLWALAILESYALLRVYGWFFDGKNFDLMNQPQSRGL
jgi:hypothetical protein